MMDDYMDNEADWDEQEELNEISHEMDIDLGSQIMRLLDGLGKSVSVNEIADCLGTYNEDVFYFLTKLEDLGWVTRAPRSIIKKKRRKRKRSFIWVYLLTDKGKRTLDEEKQRLINNKGVDSSFN